MTSHSLTSSGLPTCSIQRYSKVSGQGHALWGWRSLAESRCRLFGDLLWSQSPRKWGRTYVTSSMNFSFCLHVLITGFMYMWADCSKTSLMMRAAFLVATGHIVLSLYIVHCCTGFWVMFSLNLHRRIVYDRHCVLLPKVDLIILEGENVRPSVHKKFLRFEWNLVCR